MSEGGISKSRLRLRTLLMDKLEEQFLICEALGIDKADLIAHPELKDSTDPKLAEFKARKQAERAAAEASGEGGGSRERGDRDSDDE